MEEKELNLIELLKDCVYENFYSPICGECEYKHCTEDLEIMVFEAVKEGVNGGHMSLIFDAEGRYGYHGICMLFPSKELYEKHPLEPLKAWQEWKEGQKPYRLNLLITDEVQKNERWVPVFRIPELRFRTEEEKKQAITEIKTILEGWHKRKEDK